MQKELTEVKAPFSLKVTDASKLGQVKLDLELITPEMALEIMTNQNEHNRPLKKNTVAKYTAEMLNNNWKPTHQGIAFDNIGNLQDGQHRLQAVINSKKSQWFFVFRNLPHENFAYLDLGKNRSLTDLTYISGITENSKEFSDIASFALFWEEGRPLSALSGQPIYTIKVTQDEFYDYIIKNQDWMREVTQLTKQILILKKFVRFRALAGLLFIFGKHVSKDKAREFAYLFKTQSGLTEGNPILHMINLFVKNMGTRKKYQLRTRAVMIIRAWNSFIKGETNVPVSKVRDNGVHFPVIRDSKGKSVFNNLVEGLTTRNNPIIITEEELD